MSYQNNAGEMSVHADRPFRVAMLGLTAIERRVLQSISRISTGRSRSYEFVEFFSPGEFDIVFVDADSPQALQDWRSSVRPEPVVMIVSLAIAEQKCLKRPIMGARLLTMLDEITLNLDAKASAKCPAPVVDAEASAKCFALVVDDSPTVRKHIEQGLAPFGLDVHFAETGEEALERMAAMTYNIVFLDVVLPGIDGYAVCKAIKKDKGMKETPVIMLTGKSSTFDRIKGSLAGCDTYLTKPVEYELFQNVVKKYVGASLGVMPAPISH